MPIMIAIPDDCKPLAEAVERLVACTERATHRAAGGRAMDYAQIERQVGERPAEVERAAHQRILTALDVDAPAVVIDGLVHTRVHRDDGRDYTLAGANLAHLRDLGHPVNRKLLEVERISQQCVLSQDALDRLQFPTIAGGHR